ncbi:MAG: hypothetical protein ATN35_04765 [Epulopiscium sp. Nele67-Bin004]|nr:MAG: hypothetical protein ATN35_04765 [Epulopiscium sp. Nele67-Bin004]
MLTIFENSRLKPIIDNYMFYAKGLKIVLDEQDSSYRAQCKLEVSVSEDKKYLVVRIINPSNFNAYNTPNFSDVLDNFPKEEEPYTPELPSSYHNVSYKFRLIDKYPDKKPRCNSFHYEILDNGDIEPTSYFMINKVDEWVLNVAGTFEPTNRNCKIVFHLKTDRYTDWKNLKINKVGDIISSKIPLVKTDYEPTYRLNKKMVKRTKCGSKLVCKKTSISEYYLQEGKSVFDLTFDKVVSESQILLIGNRSFMGIEMSEEEKIERELKTTKTYYFKFKLIEDRLPLSILSLVFNGATLGEAFYKLDEFYGPKFGRTKIDSNKFIGGCGYNNLPEYTVKSV